MVLSLGAVVEVLTGWKKLPGGILFFSVLTMFRTSNLLSGKGDLSTLLLIAVLFVLPLLFIKPDYQLRNPILKLGCFLLASSARGVGIGLLACAGLTLNRWYNHPDSGQLEPLFTALTLCAGSILTSEHRLYRHVKDRSTS